MLPALVQITQKPLRDGKSFCQILFQNSYIKTVTNNTRQFHQISIGQSNRNHFQLGRPVGSIICKVCVCCFSYQTGVFFVLPITAFLSRKALHFKARSYLNTMVIFVNYRCYSYQDGISFVYSL